MGPFTQGSDNWGDGGKPVDQKYRLPSHPKLLNDVFCWMTLFDLFYIVRPAAQRALYLLGQFRPFILKADGFQRPQAAIYIVPFFSSHPFFIVASK